MIKKLAILAVLAITLVCGFAKLPRAYAATGLIYLTPATSSVQANNTIVLALRINPGTTVNGVQATVNFDTSKLQFVSVDTSGSPFNVRLQQSQTGGTLTLARGNLDGGVSSDAIVATITLKATASTGSTSVTIANANATATDSNYTNPAVQNAAVSVSVPTCANGQTGTPPNCVTPVPVVATAPTTPASPVTKAVPVIKSGTTDVRSDAQAAASAALPSAVIISTPAPKISGVNAIAQYTLASLSITTDIPTITYVKYGLDKSLKFATPESDLTTNHVINLDSKLLAPGETYYYAFVAKTAAGKIQESAVKSFQTHGLTVKIKVMDAHQKPLRNKMVVLHSVAYTTKTDNDGIATITNATPGLHHLEYKAGKKVLSQTILVANNVTTVGANQAAAVQNFALVFKVTSTAKGLVVITVLLTLILLVGAVVVLFKRVGSPKLLPVEVSEIQDTLPVMRNTQPGQIIYPKAIEKDV